MSGAFTTGLLVLLAAIFMLLEASSLPARAFGGVAKVAVDSNKMPASR